MKRILFLLSILFSVCFGAQKSFAQGNLQFNRVITLTGSLATNQGSSSSTSTVPAGKVWKIEGIWDNTANYPDIVIQVNGINVQYFKGSTGPSYSSGGTMWLKAGDVIMFYHASSSSQTNYVCSILEFNIVP